MFRNLAVCVLALAVPVSAQIVSFESTSLPESQGWARLVGESPGAERSLTDGWLVLYADLPDGWTGPTGDQDAYRKELADFAGAATFFVEWRAITDNPAWVLDEHAVPTVVSAAGRGAAIYHTTFADSKVQLFRDTSVPIVDVGVLPGVPHACRLEVYGSTTYRWYIDGVVVDSGNPQGPYPYASAFLVWGVGREYVDATTAWDYVRYGRIPEDGSGDYDSDSDVTLDDFYFVHECLTNERPGINGGPGNDAGPGCRFADFDSDTDVDLLDIAEFQAAFTGGE